MDYEINDIKFFFRNKYKYAEETSMLKEVMKWILPAINDFVQDRDVVPQLQDYLKKREYYVPIALTDNVHRREGNHVLGSILRDNRNEEIVMVIYVQAFMELVERQKGEEDLTGDSAVNYYEFYRTFVHEILHFFFSGEELVKQKTDEFLIERLGFPLEKIDS